MFLYQLSDDALCYRNSLTEVVFSKGLGLSSQLTMYVHGVNITSARRQSRSELLLLIFTSNGFRMSSWSLPILFTNWGLGNISYSTFNSTPSSLIIEAELFADFGVTE